MNEAPVNTDQMREEAIALLEQFNKVIPFNQLPEPEEDGAARTVSEDGFCAVEHGRSLGAPDKPLVTVFVQVQNMGAIQLVQHTAILTLLLQRYFPDWNEEAAWISRFAQSETQLDGLSNKDYQLRFKKVGIGIFVDIEPLT